MKIKTSELAGAALIWAAARADGRTDVRVDPDDGELIGADTFDYLEWDTAGPIIEREEISVFPMNTPDEGWCSHKHEQRADGSVGAVLCRGYGPTPRIAAMRCYVASKLGDEVDVPEKRV